MVPEGFRWWRSYHEIQEVEDVKVVKFPSSRSSGCSGIPRRSFARVRQDLVEVGLIDLCHGRSNKFVREVRTRKGNLPVMIGGQGEVWSYQERRSSPVIVAESTTSVLLSLVARESKRGWGWTRRAGASYRHGTGRNGQTINEIEGGSNGVVSRRDFRPEVEDDRADRWGPIVSVRENRRGYRFGIGLSGPRA
jgi:hypothetical protein